MNDFRLESSDISEDSPVVAAALGEASVQAAV